MMNTPHEEAVKAEMFQFQRDHLGRVPKNIDCYLIRDLLVIRLRDILTPAEQQLAKAHGAQTGRDLLKVLRTALIETNRPWLEAMIERTLGSGVLCLHHSISPEDGEEVFLFSLTSVPAQA